LVPSNFYIPIRSVQNNCQSSQTYNIVFHVTPSSYILAAVIYIHGRCSNKRRGNVCNIKTEKVIWLVFKTSPYIYNITSHLILYLNNEIVTYVMVTLHGLINDDHILWSKWVEPKQGGDIYLCNKIFAMQTKLTDNPCMSQEACEYELDCHKPWSSSSTETESQFNPDQSTSYFNMNFLAVSLRPWPNNPPFKKNKRVTFTFTNK